MLRVADIYPTIQGEGVRTGTPMIAVRLQGCPVQCVFCDTRETWEPDPGLRLPTIANAVGVHGAWTDAWESEIADYVAHIAPLGVKWVMLTGGEPAEQPLARLIHTLQGRGYRVSLETSGTAAGHLNAGCDWVRVSPKWRNPGGREIIPAVIGGASELVWVVGRRGHVEELESFLATYPVDPSCEILLQPMSQGESATRLCVEVCQERGYRLSVQVHKYINLR